MEPRASKASKYIKEGAVASPRGTKNSPFPPTTPNAYQMETILWNNHPVFPKAWTMPTLIRLIVTLLFLAALVYGGMVALVAFVEPTPKEVTVRIPARDLLGEEAPLLPGMAPQPAPSEPANP